MMLLLGTRNYIKWILITLGAVLLMAIIGGMSWFYIPQNVFTSNHEDKFDFVSTGDEEQYPPLAKEDADIVLNFNEIEAKATEISTFEDRPGSGWYGDGVYDSGNAYEGQQSLQLISLDGKTVSSQYDSDIDFAGIDYLDMMVHVDNPLAYDTLAIDVGDKEFKGYYRYKFTNLSQGWNIVQISTDQFVAENKEGEKTTMTWEEAGSIRVLLMSRPNSIATVRFDMMQGLMKNEDLLNRLRLPRGSEYRMTLYSQYGQNRLAMRNNAMSMAAQLAEPRKVDNFILAATIWPQTEAPSGLFFRGNYNNGDGYYFTVAGDLGKEWTLQKKYAEGNDTILQGELNNESIIKNEPFGVMVETRGNVIKLYLRKSEEEQFTLLGEITDEEFTQGGVGVTVTGNGWSVFDDIRYKKL
ncbi:MAG TPA: hypothetical protein DDW41_00565 [Candidatus Andersenbacteria bacterium]|nr:MAG: hypothetical protein A3B76_04705 [Candidatus Andersenbacteria bacterium RIFCSPHIGHO2_02_FULL_46_16]OGY36475.1 MAG: hypothetical protein A3I08_04265 [Candidatus Andersenbacteria bacterium RIFCSPLOWO2_02_FULL_46_11]HBE89687.1 hypothetical protein [Candidatus Andersenbacteria bacterium]